MAPLPNTSKIPLEHQLLIVFAPLLLVLISLLVGFLLCGCGGDKKESSPPDANALDKPKEDEKIKEVSQKSGETKPTRSPGDKSASESEEAKNPLPKLPDGSLDMKLVAKRYKVPERDIKTYVDRFKAMDANGDGTISERELLGAMKNLGQPITAEQAAKFIKQYDKDKNGTLDMQEFLLMLTRKTKWQQASTQAAAMTTFKQFDKDGDGYIVAEELCRAMNELGDPITLEEAGGMIKMADKNGDGRISYVEFVNMWKKYCT